MKWFSAPAASALLGCSRQHLNRLIPYWKYGVHYRDVRSPNSTKPSWQYNVDEINIWFAMKPEKRG